MGAFGTILRAPIGGRQKYRTRLSHADPATCDRFCAPCNSLRARSLALPSSIQRPCIVPSSATQLDAKLGPFRAWAEGRYLGPHDFDRFPLAAACSAPKGDALRALRAEGAYQNALPSPGVDWGSLKKSAPRQLGGGAHAGERPRPMRGCATFVTPLCGREVRFLAPSSSTLGL